MTKKVQGFHQYQNAKRFQIERVSMDELALFQDTELDARGKYVREEASRNGLKSGDYPESIQYEVELAYIEREQQLRNVRRAKHRQYLSTLDVDYVDENSLPEFKGSPITW